MTASRNKSSNMLSNLISQYGILSVIASNISSADLIHLAQTSKEHWQYIAASKPVYEHIRSTTQCDGTGIVTRAKIFHHFNGDASNAQIHCLGENARPCVNCHAQVCNVSPSSHCCGTGSIAIENPV